MSSQPANAQPVVPLHTDEKAELLHLLSLVQVEMSLLGDSAYHIGRSLGMIPRVSFALEHLPWKRGKTFVADANKLSAHMARIAELVQKLSADEQAPESKEEVVPKA